MTAEPDILKAGLSVHPKSCTLFTLFFSKTQHKTVLMLQLLSLARLFKLFYCVEN